MAAATQVGCDLKSLLLIPFLMAPALRAETFYVTVAGLGGEAEYEQRFTGWAKDIDKILKAAEPNAKVETMFGAGATKDLLTAKLKEIAKQAKPDDSLVLMMIGHGSFDESDYKFNLPGPDITGTELANLLDQIPAKHQLVVNMTSASGGSLVSLEKPGRVVITATKSGTEKNATYFTRFWVEGLRDPTADTDHNDVISALEAFRYAEQKTAKFFETQNRLATEHALISDNGAEKTDAKAKEAPLLARSTSFVVDRPLVSSDPKMQALLNEKKDIEKKIETLTLNKSSIPPAEYDKQREDLLVQLALKDQEIKQQETKKR